MFIGSVLTEIFIVGDDRDSVVVPGLDHPVHQLPLSTEGVELQDLIEVIIAAIKAAALIFSYH